MLGLKVCVTSAWFKELLFRFAVVSLVHLDPEGREQRTLRARAGSGTRSSTLQEEGEKTQTFGCSLGKYPIPENDLTA